MAALVLTIATVFAIGRLRSPADPGTGVADPIADTEGGHASPSIFRTVTLESGDSLTLGLPSTVAAGWRRLPFRAWVADEVTATPFAGPVQLEVVANDDSAVTSIWMRFPRGSRLDPLLDRLFDGYGDPMYQSQLPLDGGIVQHRLVWSDGLTELDLRWRSRPDGVARVAIRLTEADATL